MWILVVSAAKAATSDCELSETDYTSLRHDLKELRQEAGRPVAVAAEGEACERAVLSVLKNDPLLPVELVPQSSLDRSLAADDSRCGGVVHGTSSGGYQLEPMGACAHLEAAQDVQAGDHTRLFSVAYWTQRGGSIRYNGDLGLGVSFLIDAAIGFPGTDFETATPDTFKANHLLRALGGIDLAAHPGLRGAYVGLRVGVEGYFEQNFEAKTAFETEDLVTEFVLGRKFIAAEGFTVQLGGGMMAQIPLGIGPTPEELGPVIELRVGLANRRS